VILSGLFLIVLLGGSTRPASGQWRLGVHRRRGHTAWAILYHHERTEWSLSSRV